MHGKRLPACATNKHFELEVFGVASEMRVGPPEPACRGRLQTTSSCIG